MQQNRMNFQIAGYRTALMKIYFVIKSGAASIPETAQDMNDLRRHLIDVWVGVEQSVIDDGIDQWCRVSMPAFEPEENILNIHRDTN